MTSTLENDSILATDGVAIKTFDNWRDYTDFCSKDLLDFTGYIYRGQRDSTWLIQSSFDRLKKQEGAAYSLTRHLKNFKNAIRGKRSLFAPKYTKDNEWWALGRHYGLATPLVDWTISPFVALFFAFEEEDFFSKYRAVYAFQGTRCLDSTNKVCNDFKKKVDIFTVDTDENHRMIGQSSIFMKISENNNLEAITKEVMAGDKTAILMKFQIKNDDRENCLKLLSRMNINHLTVFPDIAGAADYCNMAITIRAYSAGGYINFT